MTLDSRIIQGDGAIREVLQQRFTMDFAVASERLQDAQRRSLARTADLDRARHDAGSISPMVLRGTPEPR